MPMLGSLKQIDLTHATKERAKSGRIGKVSDADTHVRVSV